MQFYEIRTVLFLETSFLVFSGPTEQLASISYCLLMQGKSYKPPFPPSVCEG